ncbi:hypothetical protein ACFOE1_09305 [Agromyces mediolanus]|uniref:Uncharacterized protein n=1 Tax=Agromyces mediolanus TaxID=41986 RepID=A0A918CD76_AGRME|nr:hypothetical protein [Agromyces mediolanus]GGR19283.1 hypothetical protein GCM10010196_10600 [Agromyces mediolanus]GLJ71325.1 hypothetical protein GCM10017583_05810 [Agromyces mediolanus]
MEHLDRPAGNAQPVQAPRDWTVDLASDDPHEVRRAAAELLDETVRAVRGLRSRMGLGDADVQDAIGETLLELAKRLEAGHPVPGAIVQRVATTVCSRFVNGPVRHETAKALRILKERVAAEEAVLGRSLSSRAVAALAEEVRLGPDFNPRHRPVERFHLVEGFSKPLSIDRYDADVVDVLLSRAVDARATSDGTADAAAAGLSGAAAGGACDRLLDRLERGRVTRREARLELWGAVAADEELPRPTQGRLDRRLAADLQAYVEALPEGVVTACREQLDGRETRAVFALFAPFADLDEPQKDAIAEALARRGGFATRIWASAVAQAQLPAREWSAGAGLSRVAAIRPPIRAVAGARA